MGAITLTGSAGLASGDLLKLFQPGTLAWAFTPQIVVPIFDGGLAIGTLRVRHAGTDQMYVRFDAEVKPISVAKLSRALGWIAEGRPILAVALDLGYDSPSAFSAANVSLFRNR